MIQILTSNTRKLLSIFLAILFVFDSSSVQASNIRSIFDERNIPTISVNEVRQAASEQVPVSQTTSFFMPAALSASDWTGPMIKEPWSNHNDYQFTSTRDESVTEVTVHTDFYVRDFNPKHYDYTLIVEGDLIISGDFYAPKCLIVEGDIIIESTGRFFHQTRKVTLTGGDSKIINRSDNPLVFYDLIVDKNHNSTLTLESSFEVAGTFTAKDGKIQSNDDVVTEVANLVIEDAVSSIDGTFHYTGNPDDLVYHRNTALPTELVVLDEEKAERYVKTIPYYIGDSEGVVENGRPTFKWAEYREVGNGARDISYTISIVDLKTRQEVHRTRNILDNQFVLPGELEAGRYGYRILVQARSGSTTTTGAWSRRIDFTVPGSPDITPPVVTNIPTRLVINTLNSNVNTLRSVNAEGVNPIQLSRFSIENESGNKFYTSNQTRKTVFASKLIPVDVAKKYLLSGDFKSSEGASFYYGLAAYDANKKRIEADHVLRTGNEAVFTGRSGNTLNIDRNVSGWTYGGSAHTRTVGVYLDGDTSKIPDFYVRYTPNGAGSRNPDEGGYRTASGREIVLNDGAASQYSALLARMIPGQTVLMNHRSGGTYMYSAAANKIAPVDWKRYEAVITGEGFGSDYSQFRQGTKYVQIMMLVNYNKKTDLDVDNLTFREITDNQMEIKVPLTIDGRNVTAYYPVNPSLREGENKNVKVRVRDEAGNEAVVTLPLVVVDTEAPVVENIPTTPITITDPTEVRVTLTIDREVVTRTYPINLGSNPRDGRYDPTIVIRDEAGNETVVRIPVNLDTRAIVTNIPTRLVINTLNSNVNTLRSVNAEGVNPIQLSRFSIENESGNKFYTSNQTRKTVFASKLIPVDVAKKYLLSGDFKSSEGASFYYGLAAYDANKKRIEADHVLRTGNEAVFTGRSGNTLNIDRNVSGWTYGGSAHTRTVGVYLDGDTSKIPDFYVRYTPNGAGSRNPDEGGYRTASGREIVLNDGAASQYSALLARMIPGQTVLMNHRSGGTYMYSAAANKIAPVDWKRYEAVITGEGFGSNYSQFRQGTKYVQIMMLVNYNKKTDLDVDNLTFREITDNQMEIRVPLTIDGRNVTAYYPVNPSLIEGENRNVKVRVRDEAGNEAVVTLPLVVVDTESPVVENIPTTPITITDPTEVRVTLTIDREVVTRTYPINLGSNPSDGRYNPAITIRDEAGNETVVRIPVNLDTRAIVTNIPTRLVINTLNSNVNTLRSVNAEGVNPIQLSRFSIENESGNKFYTSNQQRKTVFASKLIPVDVAKKYLLSGDFKSSEGASFYYGLAAYDANKKRIEADHVLRTGNEVVFTGRSGNTLNIDRNVSGWTYGGSAHTRTVGVYLDGDTSKIPDFYVRYTPNGAGSRNPDEGGYRTASGREIVLNDGAASQYSALLARMIPGQTVLMNHRSGGTYMYSAAANKIAPVDWKRYEAVITGEGFGSDYSQFRQGTKYVQIMMLVNYNKKTDLDVDNLTFREITDNQMEIKVPLTIDGRNVTAYYPVNPSLREGENKNVKVRVRDEAGNEAVVTLPLVVVDTESPVVENIPTTPITITDPTEVRVTLTIDREVVTRTYPINLGSNPSDGRYNPAITIRDEAGNETVVRIPVNLDTRAIVTNIPTRLVINTLNSNVNTLRSVNAEGVNPIQLSRFSIENESGNKFYTSNQQRKTVFASKLIPVDVAKKYLLSGDFKSSEGASFYYGLAAYDANKKRIEADHVLRTGNEVVFTGRSGNTLNIDRNVSGWTYGGSAHTRTVGVYLDGDTSKIPDFYVRYTPNGAGSRNPDEGGYRTASGREIVLNDGAASQYSALLARMIPGQTVLMNHRSGGTYMYSAAANKIAPVDWKRYEAVITGEGFGSDYSQFRQGTKYVQIMMLVNYNKKTDLDVDNLTFREITDNQMEIKVPLTIDGRNVTAYYPVNPSLREGENKNVKVRVRDEAGNEAVVTLPLVVVDTEAPVVENIPTTPITITDPTEVRVTLTIDREVVTRTYPINLGSNPSDGRYNPAITIRDEAGNETVVRIPVNLDTRAIVTNIPTRLVINTLNSNVNTLRSVNAEGVNPIQLSRFSIENESGNKFYTSNQQRKTVFASKLIPVDVAKKYLLSGDFKSSEGASFYYGLAAYDANKKRIEADHVLRTGNEVVFTGRSGNTLNIDRNVSGWTYGGSAHTRTVGVYLDGDTSKIPDFYVRYTPNGAGSRNPDEGGYRTASGREIVLNDGAASQYSALLARMIPGQTVLMNHRSGGTYMYSAAANKIAPVDWKRYEAVITGEGFGSDYSQFRQGTKYVQIMMLVNYNKKTDLDVDNLTFREITDNQMEIKVPLTIDGRNVTAYYPVNPSLREGENKNVKVRVRDEAGNEAVVTLPLVVVDTEAPVVENIPTTPITITDPTEVRVTLTIDREVVTRTYPINLGNNPSDGRYNPTITIRDEAGNETVVRIPVNLDKTGPLVTGIPTDPILTNNPHEIEVTLTIDGEEVTATYPINLGSNPSDGRYDPIIVIRDDLGNETRVRIPIILDTTPPVVEGVPTDPILINDPTRVTIPLIIDGDPVTDTYPIDLGPNPEDGIHEPVIIIKDPAGNETRVPIKVDLDTTPPVVDGVPTDPILINDPTRVTIPLIIDGDPVTDTYPIDLGPNPEDGIHEPVIIIKDPAGNETRVPIKVDLDTTPPVVEGVPTDPILINDPTRVTIPLIIDGDPITDTYPIDLGPNPEDGIHEPVIIIKDPAGNETRVPIKVDLDTTPPVVEGVPTDPIDISDPTRVTIPLIIDGDPVTDTYPIDLGPNPADGIHEPVIIIKDPAGNETRVPIKVNLDRVPPARVNIVYPVHGSFITDQTPRFEWNAVDRAARYDIGVHLVDANGNILQRDVFRKKVTGTLTEEGTIVYQYGEDPNLEAPLEHGYYQFFAKAQSHAGLWSELWKSTKFEIRETLTQTVHPVGDVWEDQPLFQWEPIEGAVSYKLRIVRLNGDGTQDPYYPVINIDGITNSHHQYSEHDHDGPRFNHLDNHSWSVQAVYPSGNTSAWSEPIFYRLVRPHAKVLSFSLGDNNKRPRIKVKKTRGPNDTESVTYRMYFRKVTSAGLPFPDDCTTGSVTVEDATSEEVTLVAPNDLEAGYYQVVVYTVNQYGTRSLEDPNYFRVTFQIL